MTHSKSKFSFPAAEIKSMLHNESLIQSTVAKAASLVDRPVPEGLTGSFLIVFAVAAHC